MLRDAYRWTVFKNPWVVSGTVTTQTTLPTLTLFGVCESITVNTHFMPILTK